MTQRSPRNHASDALGAICRPFTVEAPRDYSLLGSVFSPKNIRWKLMFLPVAAALPIGTCAAEMVYKSVDEAGQVSYSSRPPPGSIEVEDLLVAPGPSAEAVRHARERAKDTQQKVDARYRALMKRRDQQAEARKAAPEEARRERVARETAERLRRIEESLERPVVAFPYYTPLSLDWRRPTPPHHPQFPSYPPRPRPPIKHLNRPYQDHINSPLRNR